MHLNSDIESLKSSFNVHFVQYRTVLDSAFVSASSESEIERLLLEDGQGRASASAEGENSSFLKITICCSFSPYVVGVR